MQRRRRRFEHQFFCRVRCQRGGFRAGHGVEPGCRVWLDSSIQHKHWLDARHAIHNKHTRYTHYDHHAHHAHHARGQRC